MSLSESKICKPLVKPTKVLDKVVFVLLILSACSMCTMVSLDLLFVRLSSNGHEKRKKPISLVLYIFIYAGTILYFSSGSFNKPLFCSMNVKENICKNGEKYEYEGGLHGIEDPIYVAAPCKIYPRGSKYVGNSDIIDIDQTKSPCYGSSNEILDRNSSSKSSLDISNRPSGTHFG